MWRDRARRRDADSDIQMAPYGAVQPPSVTGTSSPGGSSTAAPSQQLQQAQGGSQPPGSAQHKRVYQACIPCRRRKVRCDLGSVDNPHDPPCVRCRRESKECFFSATRRKRKTDDDGSDVDEYIVRNGRKRVHASGSPPVSFDRRGFTEAPLTPGGSHGRSQPLRRPDGSLRREGDFGGDGDAYQTLENLEAQAVMRRGMFGPHDALDLLYKAATDRFVAIPLPPVMSITSKGTALTYRSPVANHERRDSRTSNQPAPPPSVPQDGVPRHIPRSHTIPVKVEQPVDPELVRSDLSAQPGYIEAIRAWQRFRFVRAGWFTALEAIEYID